MRVKLKGPSPPPCVSAARSRFYPIRLGLGVCALLRFLFFLIELYAQLFILAGALLWWLFVATCLRELEFYWKFGAVRAVVIRFSVGALI